MNNQMPQFFPGVFPNPGMPDMTSPANINDMMFERLNNRINRLERQVRVLENRLNRLEDGGPKFLANEPEDNNQMYMI